MTDEEKRMECMRLAVELYHNQPWEVWKAAEQMFNFVIGACPAGKRPDEEAKQEGAPA